ncbi:MAG TPA: hypothetical protein VF419_05230, partial [Nitrososphaeraceae archaeon]
MNQRHKLKTTASAPGKIILFGEHFVVYDKPAILASLNRRIYVKATTKHYATDNKIIINNEIFGSKTYPMSIFKEVDGHIINEQYYPVLFIMKKILGKNEFNESLELTFRSDIPYGIGLGSSAASAVAAVAALSRLFNNKKIEDKKILKLAIEAEKLVHTKSSGADCIIS